MTTEIPHQNKYRKPLKEDFDPTEELWDRLVDDLQTGNSPCLDTVAELVEQSTYLDPKGPKKK